MSWHVWTTWLWCSGLLPKVTDAFFRSRYCSFTAWLKIVLKASKSDANLSTMHRCFFIEYEKMAVAWNVLQESNIICLLTVMFRVRCEGHVAQMLWKVTKACFIVYSTILAYNKKQLSLWLPKLILFIWQKLCNKYNTIHVMPHNSHLIFGMSKNNSGSSETFFLHAAPFVWHIEGRVIFPCW